MRSFLLNYGCGLDSLYIARRFSMMKRALLSAISLIFLISTAAGTAVAHRSIRDSLIQGVDAAAGFSSTSTSTTTVSSMPSTTSTVNTSLGSGIYAAMGDSIAAGAGLAPEANPTVDDTRCGRSSQGYPNIVAQKTGLRLVNASCSGATVGDIVTKQGVPGPNITRQIDTAFSAGKPDLITITAGANDVHWVSFLRTCAATNCQSSTDNAIARGLISIMKIKMTFALQSISDRSGGSPPQVIVTGYYNPISNFCKGRQTFVSNQGIDFLNIQRDAINQAIRDTAAQFSFVSYASTNFTDHALCATDSWVQQLNDPAPFHPTATGQQHIAESVLAAKK